MQQRFRHIKHNEKDKQKNWPSLNILPSQCKKKAIYKQGILLFTLKRHHKEGVLLRRGAEGKRADKNVHKKGGGKCRVKIEAFC